ncbi:unnamed protein product [Penicillium roqueforti FM164]|uniref:Genomic scaffold, ProqFM164S03 n=1 Tax=Penicillium roqueforti (strain FM164) TaxID=1365484 RepID=W6QJJ3_PENRF|nr:unnamed protein product [Penicillium roqueforti FM164]
MCWSIISVVEYDGGTPYCETISNGILARHRMESFIPAAVHGRWLCQN